MILAVCPLSGLEASLRAHDPSHIISLLSPEAPAPRVDGATCLHLAFNDIVEPTEGLLAPHPGIVADLLDFARDWDGARPLLLHCWAGISRSTAAAYIIACSRAPDEAEARLAQALRRRAPSATPNRLMVALADAALGRQGRMSAAIAAMGRGAEAFEGEAFAWPLNR